MKKTLLLSYWIAAALNGLRVTSYEYQVTGYGEREAEIKKRLGYVQSLRASL